MSHATGLPKQTTSVRLPADLKEAALWVVMNDPEIESLGHLIEHALRANLRRRILPKKHKIAANEPVGTRHASPTSVLANHGLI